MNTFDFASFRSIKINGQSIDQHDQNYGKYLLRFALLLNGEKFDRMTVFPSGAVRIRTNGKEWMAVK